MPLWSRPLIFVRLLLEVHNRVSEIKISFLQSR
jgi:hypothetical protein